MTDRMRKIKRFLAAYFAGVVVLTVMGAIWAMPWIPSTPQQWFITAGSILLLALLFTIEIFIKKPRKPAKEKHE